MSNDSQGRPSLSERLAQGQVLCAEGYLFELERRGYVSAGGFVPEVVLEHPEALLQLHREFARAGSDIIEAFTYYAHREKMKLIGREDDLEEMNRTAIRLARQVADEHGGLVAGNICNTNIYEVDDQASHAEARRMFEEQVAWAADEGVDLVIGETFSHQGEAELALEAIRAADLPAVITVSFHRKGVLRDGIEPAETAARLEQKGAAVVGSNCMRGPATMLPILEQMIGAVSCPVAALPVPYRTTSAEPTFQSLRESESEVIPGGRPFPVALDPFTCNRYEIVAFTRRAMEIGVKYFGLCCGGAPHHVRSMAEALGRTPPASKYSPDMSKHAFFGTAEGIKKSNQTYAEEL
jgi:betaine-homocysteine S-methyltransferase